MEENENMGEENLDFQSEEVNPTEGASEDRIAEALAAEEDEPGKVKIQATQFAAMTGTEGGFQTPGNIGMLVDLQLPISVELGRVNMMIKDILELGPGAVVELNKFSGEPVDIYVNNKKFAEGEVVVVDQNFGVRILALVGPNERLKNLH